MLDPETGDSYWEIPVGPVARSPHFCDNNEEFVCLVAQEKGTDSEEFYYMVLDAETGDMHGQVAVSDKRWITAGLFPESAHSNSVLYMDTDGQERWRLRAEELVDSAYVDVNMGWNIHLSDDGYFFGMIATEAELVQDGVFERDLSLRTMAAFDRGTGDTIWSESGVGPCGTEIRFSESSPVWCRADGTFKFGYEESYGFDGETAIAGFDPATGEETWTWEHDDLGSVIYDSPELIDRVDDSRYLLRLADDNYLLDVDTGAVEVLNDEFTFWCQEWVSVEPKRVVPASPASNSRSVPNSMPCNADGEEVEIKDMTVFPDYVGATSGNVFAWFDDSSQLRAIDLGETE